MELSGEPVVRVPVMDAALLGLPMLRPPSRVAPRGSVPVLVGTQLPGSSASEPRRRMESPFSLMAAALPASGTSYRPACRLAVGHPKQQ